MNSRLRIPDPEEERRTPARPVQSRETKKNQPGERARGRTYLHPWRSVARPGGQSPLIAPNHVNGDNGPGGAYASAGADSLIEPKPEAAFPGPDSGQQLLSGC